MAIHFPEGLTALERTVVLEIIRRNTSSKDVLEAQFANASLKKRSHSGKGIFVDFQVEPPVPEFERQNLEFSVDAKAPWLEHELIGFTLFIRGGRIDWLEGYTYAGSWPDAIHEDEVIFFED